MVNLSNISDLGIRFNEIFTKARLLFYYFYGEVLLFMPLYLCEVNLPRFFDGNEDAEDLINDIKQALLSNLKL